jgi:hypothetical protein
VMAVRSYTVACILQYLQVELMLEVLSSAVGGVGDSCEGGKRRRLVQLLAWDTSRGGCCGVTTSTFSRVRRYFKQGMEPQKIILRKQEFAKIGDYLRRRIYYGTSFSDSLC